MFENLSPAQIGAFIAVLVLSISTHEAMHAFTGHWLGDSTAHEEGRITLNPLKHVDLLTTIALPLLLVIAGYPPFFAAKPVPFNPNRVRYEEFGVALVGVAGPLTNLALACVAALILRIFNLGDAPGLLIDGLYLMVYVNVGLFAFNMIPFPPLDGSRVLYAFAPDPLRDIMAKIESFGFTAIIIFMLVLFQFVSPIVDTIERYIINFLLG
jgi:Zn-dependent protease